MLSNLLIRSIHSLGHFALELHAHLSTLFYCGEEKHFIAPHVHAQNLRDHIILQNIFR